jgi:hypothetical protein
MTADRNQRPIFVIRLRAEPRVDAIRALRAFLKVALRRFGLRALTVDTERLPDDGFNIYYELEAEHEAAQQKRQQRWMYHRHSQRNPSS